MKIILSVNDYYTHFRELNTEIARWWQVDPMFDASVSPYTSMDNNPVLYNDELGDKIQYGGLRNRLNIMYLRKHDADYNKWWIENTAQYKGRHTKTDLLVHVVKGRNDLKHATLEDTRFNDGKSTGNAYLNYDGTLNHREVQVNNYQEINVGTETSTSPDYSTTGSFKIDLSSSIANFNRWTVELNPDDSYGAKPSGGFANINSANTNYYGTLVANPQYSYDQVTRVRSSHAGFSRASFEFRGFADPKYYKETLVRGGWGARKSIDKPIDMSKVTNLNEKVR